MRGTSASAAHPPACPPSRCQTSPHWRRLRTQQAPPRKRPSSRPATTRCRTCPPSSRLRSSATASVRKTTTNGRSEGHYPLPLSRARINSAYSPASSRETRVTFIDEAPDNRRFSALKYFIILTLAVGALAAVATEPEIAGWYGALNKPSFNPPNWLFAPVWTALYVIMAVAAWRVWRVVGLKSVPLVLFFVQLALNFAWSFLFFRSHLIGVALADIGLLL